MGEFAALEVKVEAIWWQDRDTATGDGSGDAMENGGGRGRAERGISASFHPLCREREERQGIERSWGDGDTLNYNPLRDTAEFAFKIKRT